MAFSKVILNGTTLIDLTSDTIDASSALTGKTGHGADGESFTGVYEGATINNQNKSVAPSESAQSVTYDSGYTGLGTVSIGAISSTYIGSDITQDPTPTVSGATVTIPKGYYSSNTSKSVSSGTAGTPSASKGTVNNHSVTVTPSVTNTTGYITGGTKTGTAVTVTASELASGNKSITNNGSDIDVVGYSTVSVAIPFQTIYTGSSDPSSSTGNDGDIYIKVVS